MTVLCRLHCAFNVGHMNTMTRKQHGVIADLTSCEQLQHWNHNGDLVYNDHIVLLVLPAGKQWP